MTLLIIRHGESGADLLNVHEGRADFELTERGHRQAEAMAGYVRDHFAVGRIYASTLKRAAQTAEHLSRATGCPVVFSEDLMEFDNGLLAGLPYAEAAEKYPEPADLPEDQAVYGQEPLTVFRRRAERALDRIRRECAPADTVAVVTHGGMINQLYGAVLGLPLKTEIWFGTGDTGIHVWELKNGAVRIIKANRSEHARGI